MPYCARKHQLEGNLVYHVMNRSNRRLEIFHEEEDYLYFKVILLRYVTKEGLIIYHYCIMPNHYHLEIELEQPERMSSIMAGVNRAYTYYYHEKYKTSGYLWQGRFKSKPIQKNKYLLNCGRYIETNPVRAKMVERAEDYSYSSARYYVTGDRDDIVAENPLYEEFGLTIEERRDNYSRFLADFEFEEREKCRRFSDFTESLGDEGFKAKLYKREGRWYPRRQGRVRN